MDNLSYLQSISAKPKRSGLLGGDLFQNKKLLIGLAGAFVLALLIIIIGSLNKGGLSAAAEATVRLDARTDNMIKLLNNYNKSLKSSELRGMGTSLKSVLQATAKPLDNSLKSDFGELEKEDTSDITIEETNFSADLETTLENARLNATLDRVFPREMTYHIYQLLQLQRTCLDETSNDDLSTALTSAIENLTALYDQFSTFSDRSS